MSTIRHPLIATKIIATLGPASREQAMIKRLIDHGVDVVRLNFSHGSFDDHANVLAAARAASLQAGRPIAVLGDLCGPKIRLSDIADRPIETGEVLRIGRGPAENAVHINYDRFLDEVQVGHRVLIDDGALRFIVVEKAADVITCSCTHGGILKSRKGVNLPDTKLSLDSLTEHDRNCVKWAIEHQVDYLALSFVRSAADMNLLRQLVEPHDPNIHLVAKIEKPEAMKEIDSIIEASDAIMIARGDLGVEMDLAQVPIIQKDLIQRCRKVGKTVIVATQMLQSMVESPTPTRAEASDVANAIFDGTDAIMLSGETAAGKHPDLAAAAMDHIAAEIEAYLRKQAVQGEHPMPVVHIRELDAALARGAWQVVHSLAIKAVVVFSRGGANARVFSKLRLPVPVVALTQDPRTARRLCLYYGIVPRLVKAPDNTNAQVRCVTDMMLKLGIAGPGERVVIIGGIAADGEPVVSSNAIMVHEITAHGLDS
ncbi:MAG: pyruvate kinase [Planctomycetes bacterium]|nr:pyruvate kinase [Planctomycetota bacterium]